MRGVTIYTKPGCPYCAAAKKYYAEQGMEFEEYNVLSSPDIKERVIKLTGGSKIVPVIVDHGEVRLGFGGS
jgi:glutaredoxin 3